jgi:1-acyl-sn-glycerol-3-phosphate acyltransferase
MYDILVAFYISGYFNRVIGFCLKKQIAYVPGIGWWCTYMKFPLLNRNKDDLKILETDNTPFPVIIYPEGTRFNVDKYSENYKYAKQNDYPISNYAMLPKSRGSFAISMNKKTIYQMTLVYMDEHQRIMKGEINTFPARVYVHVKRHENIPTNETEYKTWLHTQFANIDSIYDNFNPVNAIKMVPRYNPVDYIIYAGYGLLHLFVGYAFVCAVK